MDDDDLLTPTPEGLACPAAGLHVDPWGPVDTAVITHAHADHLRPGAARYLCAAPSAPLLARRLPAGAAIEAVPYGARVPLGGVTLSLHPAGHVLGSAQVRLERGGEVWVVTGDFKRAPDPTCAPFEVVPCDVLVTEATFGLPIYRWRPAAEVVGEVVAWVRGCGERGRAAVLLCYALGKAQRVLAELAALEAWGERRVWLHGAIAPLVEAYRAAGVRLAPTAVVGDAPRGARFAGELVLAPPSAHRSPWLRRLGEQESALASGWMRLRRERRRRGVDRGFVLSDHADWPALLRTARETGARRVLVTHGHTDALVRALGEAGLDAAALPTEFQGEADFHAGFLEPAAGAPP
ncbi:MAG: ligase-associated DNA damage response exonuclease [Planctomycetes bacterium]|nr:ligase-associated DNA damage response exonuclease [Planctomycetota bacterium]